MTPFNFLITSSQEEESHFRVSLASAVPDEERAAWIGISPRSKGQLYNLRANLPRFYFSRRKMKKKKKRKTRN